MYMNVNANLVVWCDVYVDDNADGDMTVYVDADADVCAC